MLFPYRDFVTHADLFCVVQTVLNMTSLIFGKRVIVMSIHGHGIDCLLVESNLVLSCLVDGIV